MGTEPILVVDFYRISIKINYKLKSTPFAERTSAVFFNTPDLVIAPGWEAEQDFTGMYLQLSKKVIEENRFLFKTYLDYGQHEALFLTDEEVQEISSVFKLMMKYYESDSKNRNVLLSYVNVIVSLVEAFYKRQFSTDPKHPLISVVNYGDMKLSDTDESGGLLFDTANFRTIHCCIIIPIIVYLPLLLIG